MTNSIKWEQEYNNQLTLLNEIRDNKDLLRFDNRYIKICDVARQYYCEKKVELSYIHGDIETEQKILGREGHDELAKEFEEISMQQGWKQIFSSPRLSLSEFLFFAKYEDLYLVFRPDRVLFLSGIPKMLIEYKFSKYKRPFISHHVQLQAEGFLFKKLGFDISFLCYAIIIAPLDTERESKSLNNIPKIIYNKLKAEITEEHFNFGKVNAYIYKFDTNLARKNFEWALEYWKKERKAEFTDNKNKCRSCEYSDSCMKENPLEMINIKI